MNKRTLIVVACLAASSAYAVPAASAAKDRTPPPPVPTESGCYDILPTKTEGDTTSSGYQRLVASVNQTPIVGAAGLYGPATVTYQPRGVFDGKIEVAATSCPGAVYVVTLTDRTTGAPVKRVTAAGDGSSKVVTFEVVVNHEDECVRTVLSVEDGQGNVIDVSPDPGAAPVDSCDGGGAGSYTN